MLVDHHCHLDFPDFAADRAGYVARAKAAGVATLVTISTRVRNFDIYRGIAEDFPDVYFSVGTHPHQAHEELDISVEEIVAKAAHPKCVAVGEAGLDYFYRKSPPPGALPIRRSKPRPTTKTRCLRNHCRWGCRPITPR